MRLRQQVEASLDCCDKVAILLKRAIHIRPIVRSKIAVKMNFNVLLRHLKFNIILILRKFDKL